MLASNFCNFESYSLIHSVFKKFKINSNRALIIKRFRLLQHIVVCPSNPRWCHQWRKMLWIFFIDINRARTYGSLLKLIDSMNFMMCYWYGLLNFIDINNSLLMLRHFSIQHFFIDVYGSFLVGCPIRNNEIYTQNVST